MPHPHYENAPISEALCEIHFELDEGIGWKGSFPGELFRRIQEDFPEFEPIQDFGIHLQTSPSGDLAQRILQPRPRFRYKHKSEPILAQLSENIITLNALPKYPGFEAMLAHVRDVWEHALAVLKPARVKRLGLRYINRIPKDSIDQRASDWFNPNEYIAQAALESNAGMISRVEARKDADNRTVVTLGDQPGSADEPGGAFIFDIDRIVEKELSTRSDDIVKETRTLNEDAWKIFKAAKTNKLDGYMGRDLS